MWHEKLHIESPRILTAQLPHYWQIPSTPHFATAVRIPLKSWYIGTHV